MASEILDIPEHIKPSTMSLTMASNTKVFESAFNKSTSTAKFAGDRWQLTLSFENLDYEIDTLSAFLFRIGGKSGRVRIPPYHRIGSPAAGSPVVQGSEQTGGMMTTKGWMVNRRVLRAGQYFQVGDELKILVEDCLSDNMGNATMIFVPWLRKSPSDGEKIITKRPTGIFRLTEDATEMELEPMNGSASVSFTEAFYV
tara:strand:+ start:183 stop:779 length:597 start_codon:yes stop_codon:yes gene_type:complete